MSKDLTDVDAFSSPIHVPENADSRNDAAGDVELVAQRLANRTHYLNLRTAKLAAANAFVGNQGITGTLGVSGLATVGGLAVSGSAAIPTVSGNVAIAGSLDAGADIFAADDVIAGNEFQYGAPLPTRTILLPLFNTFGEGVLSFAGGTYHIQMPAAADVQVFPIWLPHTAEVTRVQVVLNKPGTGSTSLHVMRKQGYDWTNPVGAMPNDFTFGPSADTTAGDRMIDLAMSQVLDNEQVQLFAVVTAGDNDDRIYGVRVTFVDPGPRSH